MKRFTAFTIAETLIALVVLAILSLAVSTLVRGAINTDNYTQAEYRAISEVDAAQRRIMYNLRTASAVPTWSQVSSKWTLTITKTGVGSVLYYVDGNGNLVEDDPRYDPTPGSPNILVHAITSAGFSCTITAPSGSGAATMVKVDLAVPVARPVERHVSVAVRTH